MHRSHGSGLHGLHAGVVAVPVICLPRKYFVTPTELFATEAETLTVIGIPGAVAGVMVVQVTVAPLIFRAVSSC